MKKGKLMLDNVETLIFKDFVEYYDLREDDDQLNGCDQSFLDYYYNGDYIKWYEDNENNTGCWNCLRCDGCHYCDECIDCDNCGGCIECKKCKECYNCEDCFKCVNCEGGIKLHNEKDYDDYTAEVKKRG